MGNLSFQVGSKIITNRFMSKITIVANIYAKVGKISFVKAELLKLIEPTRSKSDSAPAARTVR